MPLSRKISLALVTVIILSCIRVALMGVMRLFRITSCSMSASLMLLVLAQLIGIYLLSTVVQLRTPFPPSADADTSASASPNVAKTNLLSLRLVPHHSRGGMRTGSLGRAVLW
ncbi:hypothetical protein BKA82DRAFT_4148219 [Pisolithus tinctorius]|nr:hypothetical protein BKA82DRAFT_4192702 [Pisolithus tinctorius]KAI6148091.1 hypothetical protein BKA82DRAFT_4148219 [Pisolithus tinctorius]